MNITVKNKNWLKKFLVFNILILSTLSAQAGPMDKLKKLFGNDTDFLTIFYIIAGMFVVCLALYLIGNYFMKKEEAKNAAKRAEIKPSAQTQMRRAQRRKR